MFSDDCLGLNNLLKKQRKKKRKEEEKNKRCMPKSTQKWTFLILTNLDVKGNIFSVKLVQSVT